MIKLREATITDGVPRAVAQQPWVKALAQTWLAMAVRALDTTDNSRVYTNINNLSEELLDALAVELRAPQYLEDYDIETKRATVKASMPYYNTTGTKAAVVNVVRELYGESAVQEWFEYDGEPGCFRVRITAERALNVQTVIEQIDHNKRASAYMEELDLFTDERMRITTGFAGVTVSFFQTTTEAAKTDFEWFGDELAETMTDELGNILVDADAAA